MVTRGCSRVLTQVLLGAMVLVRAQVAAAADCIRPSPDVVNGVALRAAPTTSSASLGTLKPGESLPFVGSVPSWYETSLSGGQQAFISKRWTDVSPCPGEVAPTQFEVHAIDVGTGLAVLVRGPDFSLLYDGGSNDDVALGDKNRLLAYLKTLSPPIAAIDHLIVSHPHRDHVELLPDVLTRIPVREVWDSGAFSDICGYRHVLEAVAAHPATHYHSPNQNFGEMSVSLSAKNCYGQSEAEHTLILQHGSRIDDQPIRLGEGATMTFLHADGSTKTNLNENSLVVRVDLGDHHVLLEGDAEAGGRKPPATPPSAGSTEAALLQCCAAVLKADVLVVGHHGSLTSSRRAFLDAVGAQYFIISAGPTKYGSVVLPDPEIIAELEQRGQVFRTDLNDDQCGLNAAKTGPDNDGKPGGCDNVVVTLPSSGAITVTDHQEGD